MTHILQLPAALDPIHALDRLSALDPLDVDTTRLGLRVLLPDLPDLAGRVRIALGLGPDAPVDLRLAPLRDGNPPTRLAPPALSIDGTAIHLAAGDAFGTGAHPTTALCLDWLTETPMPARVLDVGTGTGVLAISAALRGAGEVLGVDADPAAIAEARVNVARNSLDGRITVRLGGPEGLDRYPLVLANILAGPLLTLAPALGRVVARRGELLLSGIPAGVVDEVAAVYVRDGFKRGEVATSGGWACLVLRASW